MLKFAICAALILPGASFAYEVRDACVTYIGTGASYNVEVNIYTGRELNDRTKSYQYQSYSKYVVVFWSEGATVIEMASGYCIGEYSPCEGKDQRGYLWTVKLDPYFC